MLWHKIHQNIITNGVEIFFINPSILYEYPELVVYCSCNASTFNSIEHMNYGFDGLCSMFETNGEYVNNTNEPTDVQAEVLFKGTIKKEYILRSKTDLNSIYYGNQNSFHRKQR